MARKNTKPKAISAASPYRDAMRVLIGARWADLWEAVPRALDASDPEGVHDVRVASRRLRAAMDVADGCFPERWYRPLHKAAKEITGALGEPRDQDVLLEAFHAQRKRIRVADRAGIDHLIAQIETRRDTARAEMAEYLSHLEKRGIRTESAKRFPAPKRKKRSGTDVPTGAAA
jgi:CHAD domain-containing protein